MQQYGRLLALRNEMQEQPLRMEALQAQAQGAQAQAQGEQQQNQIRAVQLKDTQAMTAAMQQWDGKDFNSLIPLVVKNGGSAQAVMSLKNNALKMQQTYSQIAASDAATGAKNLQAIKDKHDMVAGAVGNLLNLPDDQLAQGLGQTAQELSQQGLLEPAHAQQALQLAQSGNPALIRQQLGYMQKSMMSQTQLMEQAKTNAQIEHNKATEDLAKTTAANTQAYRQGELDLRRGQLGMEQQRIKLQQEQLGYSPSGEPSDLAQAIASGHVAPERLSYLLTRNPGLIQGVLQVDPSFDSSKAAAYPQVYKDFTSSKPNTAGGSLLAGSTALEHLKELKELNDKNPVDSRIPGKAAYNSYENKVDTVAGELARFYGTDTVPGIENIKKTLNATFNRDAAILTQVQSMGDRLDNYEQTWRNAAPSKMYEAPMPGVSEAAKQARAALDPSYAARIRESAPKAAAALGIGSIVTQGGHRFKVTAVDKNGKPTAADALP